MWFFSATSPVAGFSLPFSTPPRFTEVRLCWNFRESSPWLRGFIPTPEQQAQPGGPAEGDLAKALASAKRATKVHMKMGQTRGRRRVILGTTELQPTQVSDAEGAVQLFNSMFNPALRAGSLLVLSPRTLIWVRLGS